MFQRVQIISKCGQVRHLQRNQIDVGGHRTGDLLSCVSILIDVAKTLFATHYHELTELEGKLSSVNNFCIAVQEEGEDRKSVV